MTEWGANCSADKSLADWQSRCPPVEADPFFQYMVQESPFVWVDGELFDGTPWLAEGQLGVDGTAAAGRCSVPDLQGRGWGGRHMSYSGRRHVSAGTPEEDMFGRAGGGDTR